MVWAVAALEMRVDSRNAKHIMDTPNRKNNRKMTKKLALVNKSKSAI